MRILSITRFLESVVSVFGRPFVAREPASSPNAVGAIIDQVLFLLAETADDFLEARATRNVVHVRGHRLRDGRKASALMSNAGIISVLCRRGDTVNICEGEGGFRKGDWGLHSAFAVLKKCTQSEKRRKGDVA